MQTVLLIEHDSAHLIAQAMVLRCFGYKVLEASTQLEAARACREHRGPVHLAVTKAVRGQGSEEVVARLQRLCPQIRVLFLSDRSSAECPGPGCAYGECAILQKPFGTEAIADALQKLLEDSRAMAASA
jgi:DNA-binding NarL/FixJ family response regulator